MRHSTDADADRIVGTFSHVGRKQELSLLVTALERPPAVALVEGEAGIGKSRLVREVAAIMAQHGRRTLIGYCHPLREPVPYGPVIDALSKAAPLLPPVTGIPRMAGVLAPLLPDLADRLPRPPADGHRNGERQRLLQGVRSLLSAVGPVLLAIEDMHWADEITRELLLLLTRDMPEQLSLVLTFRGEDVGAGTLLGSAYRRQPGTSGTAVHLSPISHHDVEALAVEALGGCMDEALTQALYSRSAGLPLVVEEDLLTLREHRRRNPAPDGPAPASDLVSDLQRAEIPHSLREAFIERFEALSAAGKAIVEAAAVLAVPAHEDLLIGLSGLEASAGRGAITEALHGMVLRETESGDYTFRHVLAQQVAYKNIPGPRRRQLHLQAVRALEAQKPPPLVQITHHTLRAGDHAGWPARAEAAVDQAIGLGDDGTAAALLHQILKRPGLPEQTRTRAALNLSRIAIRGTDYAANASVLQRILANPSLDRTARGEIRLSLGLLVVNHIGDSGGYQEVERSVGELADRPELAARAMIALAMNEQGGASEQAWTWMRQAEQTLADSPDEAMRATAEATRLTLMARDGDPAVWDAMDRLPRQEKDVDVGRQRIRALFNVGELAMELGHDQRAQRMLAEARELTEQVNFPWMQAYISIAQLRLRALGGAWDGVEEKFTALQRRYPDIAMGSTEYTLAVGHMALAKGHRTRALELFSAAADFGVAEPSVTTALRAAAGLTMLRLDEDAPVDAWATAEPALTILRRAGAWTRATGLVPAAVEAALAVGRCADAERLIKDAGRGLRGRDAPAADAELKLARGRLFAGTKASVEQFAAARDLWIAIGRPYDAARAAECLAKAIGNDDPRRASAYFEEAMSVYRKLRAVHNASRCEHVMKDLGVALSPTRGRRGYGDALSPRERQVAEFLARGATNNEIADKLFLSPRTVEVHVAHVLRKLGTPRKQVAAALKAQKTRR